MIYAVGAQTDRRLGIPGEDLPGSWAATELVAWYNGHPDFQELEFDLSHERAVVIGNGNVALDVARMLALTPEELAPTDTTDPAIAAINAAGIREILVLGRRGPVQAAWTPVEVGELGEMAGADIVVDAAQLELDPTSEAELASAAPTVRRNVDHLRDFAAREPAGKPRAIRLRFCASPVEIHGNGRVEAIEVVRNELEPTGDGRVRAVATDERETIPCGIVFRSVGYHGVPVPDVVRRTLAARSRTKAAASSPASYAAGWIKRGPSGVIGTNKKDATETVELLLADARAGLLRRREGGRLEALLSERGVEPVLYEGLGGDRRRRARRRRAARPPPREAAHLGRAPDGRPPTVRRCVSSRVTRLREQGADALVPKDRTCTSSNVSVRRPALAAARPARRRRVPGAAATSAGRPRRS